MSLDIVTLESHHLEDAARLVGQRYRALRERVPALPTRYGERDTLLPMLQNILGAGPAVAALDRGQLVGFMAGYRFSAFRQRPAVISPEWGNGARLPDSGRIYEAMYSRLSAEWVADGRVAHLVAMLPIDHQGTEEWHWLGFGMAAADAVRNLEPVPLGQSPVAIRRASPDDVDSVLRMESALTHHLSAPPVFRMGYEPWTHEEAVAQLRDPSYAFWLAIDDSRPVAYLLTGPASDGACTIIRDEGTCSITGAFTVPSARGTGVATALLDQGLAWARDEGYERCAVDFETMNPQARRFWLRYFSPVSIALERQIDSRATQPDTAS